MRRPGLELLLVALVLVGCTAEPCPPGERPEPPVFNVDVAPTAVPLDEGRALPGQEAFFERGALFDALPGRTGCHAPTLTALPDGSLLAAFYAYAGPGELDEAVLYLSRRPAGAASWDAPVIHRDTPASIGNPVLYSEGTHVWLFAAVVPGTGWSTAHIELQESDDGGWTWSAPQAIGGLGSNVRNPPVRTADGLLLLPAYDDLFQRGLILACADGATWNTRATIGEPLSRAAIQPALAMRGDGRLLALLRNAGGGWLWAAAGDADGRCWSEPIDSGLPNPASPVALLRLAGPAGVAAPLGPLVLVFNDSRTERRPLSTAISADDGATWHPPRILAGGADEAGEFAYPAAVQTPDGRVHVLFSEDRRRIGHVMISAEWTASPAPAGVP